MVHEIRTEFEIPVKNLPKLEHEIEKIAKRARKLILPEPACEVLGQSFIKEVSVPRQRGYAEWSFGTKINVRFVNVRVSGEAPRLAGWRLVAVIDHASAARNMIRAIPTKDKIEIPAHLRTAEATCDHCNLDRPRNDTFLLVNDEGEFMRVGRTCLKDFTGHKSPEAIASYMESLLAALENEGEWADTSEIKRQDIYFRCEKFLTHVAALIDSRGWVSRSAIRRGETNGPSTSEAALFNMWPSDDADPETLIKVEDKHNKIARNTIRWVRKDLASQGHDGLSNFEWNLIAVLEGEYLILKNAGIAASAVWIYLREMDKLKDIEAAKKAPSEHVGKVGERISVEVAVTKRIDYQDYYRRNGTYCITVMEDFDGNVFVWKTGSRMLEIGDLYEITGTVKEHTVHNGRKNTVLTRCRVKEM